MEEPRGKTPRETLSDVQACLEELTSWDVGVVEGHAQIIRDMVAQDSMRAALAVALVAAEIDARGRAAS